MHEPCHDGAGLLARFQYVPETASAIFRIIGFTTIGLKISNPWGRQPKDLA
jgi:hypothetical protein